MRTVSRFPTLFILLASVCFFPTVVFAVSSSDWVGDVYGNAELWGLDYSRPFTSSSHYIMVSNESAFVARYLYEFKTSILEAGFEERVPVNPQYRNIGIDQVVVESTTINIDMNNVPGIDDNDMFTLDCYTRISISTKFDGRKGWKVSDSRPYIK